MNSGRDPNECGVCGTGLHERGAGGNLQRIGEVFETVSSDAIEQMDGTPEQKREAKRGISVKVGFCPDCLDEYGLEPGDLDGLSEAYDKISLYRTEVVPDRHAK